MANPRGTKPAHWTDEDWQAALKLCEFIRRVKARRIAGGRGEEHK